MNAKDLEGIVVAVPGIEVQKLIAKKYNNQLSTLYALKEEVRNIENKLANFYVTEVLE